MANFAQPQLETDAQQAGIVQYTVSPMYTGDIVSVYKSPSIDYTEYYGRPNILTGGEVFASKRVPNALYGTTTKTFAGFNTVRLYVIDPSGTRVLNLK